MIERDSENRDSGADWLWIEQNEAACLEFRQGRFPLADKYWKKAYEVSRSFSGHDPRSAASLNNMAIGLRINGNFKDAEQVYKRAIESWEAASEWVEGMHLVQRARSSLFHLRMETKHRERYDRIALKRYQALLPAGLASAMNNLAELFQAINRRKKAKALYDRALRIRTDALGEQELGVATIRENLDSLSENGITNPENSSNMFQESNRMPFVSQALQHGWVVDQPARFTDEGKFMAAITLTCLVDHSRIS